MKRADLSGPTYRRGYRTVTDFLRTVAGPRRVSRTFDLVYDALSSVHSPFPLGRNPYWDGLKREPGTLPAMILGEMHTPLNETIRDQPRFLSCDALRLRPFCSSPKRFESDAVV